MSLFFAQVTSLAAADNPALSSRRRAILPQWPTPGPLGDPTGRAARQAGVMCAIFAVLSALAAWSSQGFLEADAGTHYLFARFAFSEPTYLVNVWGRPLCTLLYAGPAALGGVMGVRLASLALALMAAWATFRIATELGLARPQLAVLALLAQPLFFLHSFSEMTELPFLTLLALAFYAYQRRKWGWVALLAAIAPAARPEGFGLLLAAGVALVAHRRAWWLAILPVPLAAWSFLGWMAWGGWTEPLAAGWWRWLFDHWPYSPVSSYAAGPLIGWTHRDDGRWAFSFLLRLPIVSSPLFFPFMLLGLYLLLRGETRAAKIGGKCATVHNDGNAATAKNAGKSVTAKSDCGTGVKNTRNAATQNNAGNSVAEEKLYGNWVGENIAGKSAAEKKSDGNWALEKSDRILALEKSAAESAPSSLAAEAHRRRCLRLAALAPLGILLVHSLLWWRGRMASSGELRYLLVAGPFWAIATAIGLNWLAGVRHWLYPVLWAGLMALAPLAANVAYPCVPLKLYSDDLLARDVAAWYRADAAIQQRYPRIAASCTSLFYALDLSFTDPARAAPWSRRMVAHRPPGVLLVWDAIYGTHNADAGLCVSRQDILQAGWRPLRDFSRNGKVWEVYVSD